MYLVVGPSIVMGIVAVAICVPSESVGGGVNPAGKVL